MNRSQFIPPLKKTPKLSTVIKLVLNCLIAREAKRIGLVVINVLRRNGTKHFVKILKPDLSNVESPP